MRLALTKRTDYAIRALLCVARAHSPSPLSSRRIAAEMAIPPRFVPHVLGDLVRAGLVEATSGKRGGYRLAHALDGLSLLELIEAVEGPTAPRGRATDAGVCLPGDPCNVDQALADARQAFVAVLADASFADIVGRPPITIDHSRGRERPERNPA